MSVARASLFLSIRLQAQTLFWILVYILPYKAFGKPTDLEEIMSKRRVAYYYDSDVGAYTYGTMHIMKPHRIRMTHDLVSAYGMLDKMTVLKPKRTTPEAMTAFHTDEYVHFLRRVTPETVDDLTFHGTRFLLGEDNPSFDGLFEFCSISAGGSIAAAHRLTSGASDIAINWAGGLHHAKKREASGFCYINDIVLGIIELLRSYPRVLYIDCDIHHGDGVEEAFYSTDRVMTCSFHKFGDFFPGTGTVNDTGVGKGKGYSVNVPLKDGITDSSFRSLFDPIIDKIMEVYRPSAVVLQLGADSLAGDRLGCFNMTMEGHAHCVQHLRAFDVPLILLGGGGYTIKNVARAWTYETACALGIEETIPRDLPWTEYFDWFGPRFKLEVVDNNMDDHNNEAYLQTIRKSVMEQLRNLNAAPSVGIHDVPRESLGSHLRLGPDENEDLEAYDELDERLAQHARLAFSLQEAAAASGSDSDSSASSASSRPKSHRSRHRTHSHKPPPKRMSIVTNSALDLTTFISESPALEYGAPMPNGRRRKFFQNKLPQWEENVEKMLAAGEIVNGPRGVSVGSLMVNGGRNGTGVDDDWDDASSAVLD